MPIIFIHITVWIQFLLLGPSNKRISAIDMMSLTSQTLTNPMLLSWKAFLINTALLPHRLITIICSLWLLESIVKSFGRPYFQFSVQYGFTNRPWAEDGKWITKKLNIDRLGAKKNLISGLKWLNNVQYALFTFLPWSTVNFKHTNTTQAPDVVYTAVIYRFEHREKNESRLAFISWTSSHVTVLCRTPYVHS